MATKKDLEKIADDGSHTLSAPPKHAELPASSQPEAEDETAKGAAKSEPAPTYDPDEHPRTAKPSPAD